MSDKPEFIGKFDTASTDFVKLTMASVDFTANNVVASPVFTGSITFGNFNNVFLASVNANDEVIFDWDTIEQCAANSDKSNTLRSIALMFLAARDVGEQNAAAIISKVNRGFV